MSHDPKFPPANPLGRWRFGVVYAPEPTSFFVTLDAAGAPRGVTVDLAEDLGRALETAVEFVTVPNSGQLVGGLLDGTLDAAFMPVDAQRQAQVDFGPAYTLAENTYLIRAGAGIESLAAVDREGVRVIGIAGTTTLRSAAGLLARTSITAVASVGDALEALTRGSADAFALTRDALRPLLPRMPGATVLDETFREVRIAIAVPRGRPGALATVTGWLEAAKADGTVRRLLDRAGLHDIPVADAAARGRANG